MGRFSNLGALSQSDFKDIGDLLTSIPSLRGKKVMKARKDITVTVSSDFRVL
jgi:hypothetical protein